MIASKESYMQQLRDLLKEHEQSEEICREYELHLADMLEDIVLEKQYTEQEAITIAIERLGFPKEIAALYQEELTMTAKKTQWNFFFANLFFFVGGIGLTVIYHHLSNPTISKLWLFLTSIPFFLIILYLFFWLLLGYEVGKEFGLGGKKLLMKTFCISLVPNLLLMCSVVFKIIPSTIFDPLLTPEFILICISFTIMLYPICFLAFRYGTTRSV
ncbi:permease prefix domain 1-containing protein [Niallia alba]|uniref:DUF1700 domain-containing protein n=1 Tax=Niallia alba TaxID=2729105 RepID=A0A7Y0KA68_9BACI|nr:permease prefix domain 1-containing protein [Niallia alba]EOR23024.1 integral inner membrane protein [Niallia nealsonii AAU1]NMO77985.1 hypothetical protein [Niallia alba]